MTTAKRYYTGDAPPRNLLSRMHGTEEEPARGFAPTLDANGSPRLLEDETVLWEGPVGEVSSHQTHPTPANPWKLTSSGFWLTDSRVLWVSDRGHFGKGQVRLEWIAKVASFAKSGHLRSASSTLNIWAVIDSREQDTGHNPSAATVFVSFVMAPEEAARVRDLIVDTVIAQRLLSAMLPPETRAKLQAVQVGATNTRGVEKAEHPLPGWRYAPPYLDTRHVTA